MTSDTHAGRPTRPRPDGPEHRVDPQDRQWRQRAGVTRIPRRSGAGVALAAGDRLTVIDPLGEQVSDLFLVDAHDLAEVFSGGRTADYRGSIYIGPGDRLYSNRSRVMATVVRDTVGVHDLTLTPCAQETFDILYPELGGAPHPSCHANLRDALAPWGFDPDRIATTLNLFMDVWTCAAGDLHIDPPPTVPGDVFTLQAERDLLVGITACSADKSNAGRCTPVDFSVERA